MTQEVYIKNLEGPYDITVIEEDIIQTEDGELEFLASSETELKPGEETTKYVWGDRSIRIVEIPKD